MPKMIAVCLKIPFVLLENLFCRSLVEANQKLLSFEKPALQRLAQTQPKYFFADGLFFIFACCFFCSFWKCWLDWKTLYSQLLYFFNVGMQRGRIILKLISTNRPCICPGMLFYLAKRCPNQKIVQINIRNFCQGIWLANLLQLV